MIVLETSFIGPNQLLPLKPQCIWRWDCGVGGGRKRVLLFLIMVYMVKFFTDVKYRSVMFLQRPIGLQRNTPEGQKEHFSELCANLFFSVYKITFFHNNHCFSCKLKQKTELLRQFYLIYTLKCKTIKIFIKNRMYI